MKSWKLSVHFGEGSEGFCGKHVLEGIIIWLWTVATRPSRTNTQKRCPFLNRGLECKSRKSRITWSNRQIWPWSAEWSRTKANRVLPRERTGHSKHPLPTMCRVFSCVVGRGCLLWWKCFLDQTLLAFALLHSVLQGQICQLLQVILDFLLLHSSPL